MKQQVAVSIAGLMLLTAGCENANGKMPFDTLADSMNAKKKPGKATPQDIGEKNIHDQWQGRSNPSLYDGGFFVRGDFLYWRADEDGLQYAVQATIVQSVPTIKSKVLFPDEKWNPGFRVGIGYTFSHKDYWELSALWTHYQTHQSASKSSQIANPNVPNGTAFVPWWGASILGALTDKASVHWHLNFNTYDLDLGRNYFVAKTLSVHPFLGLRGATIKQKYKANYEALVFNPTASLLPTSFKADTDFWGIGAHIGSGLQWRFNSCFSLLGNIGGSLLYGDFDIKQNADILLRFGGGPITTTMKTPSKQHFTTGTFNIDAMIGFQWEKFFSQNRYRVAIAAGYEWSEWFSQNRIMKADLVQSGIAGNPGSDVLSRENGNLLLQGANLQVRLDF